jgi:hypothetical protein
LSIDDCRLTIERPLPGLGVAIGIRPSTIVNDITVGPVPGGLEVNDEIPYEENRCRRSVIPPLEVGQWALLG